MDHRIDVKSKSVSGKFILFNVYKRYENDMANYLVSGIEILLL
jgi:hypothetical protein